MNVYNYCRKNNFRIVFTLVLTCYFPKRRAMWRVAGSCGLIRHRPLKVSLKNGKTYFFSGNQYIRFDRKKHRADPGYPKKLNTDNWFGLEFERIDAAISVGDNIIQLISGDKSDTWNVEKSN